jgi:proliferating cell nuclear antigen
LDTISSLIIEGNFLIDKNGIKLIAMDPASVAMVTFHLLPSAFIDFSVDKQTTVTLSIDKLVNVLRRANVNDQVTLQLDEEANKMKILMKGKTNRNFSIPIIEGTKEEQKVPELKFNAKVELEAEVLKNAVKDAAMISDCLIFEADKDKLLLYSKGDYGDTQTEVTKESQSLISINVSEKSKAKYSIEYLDKMMKASKLADVVTIQFSSDYPIKMDFKSLDKLQLSFILAPRVDTE